MASSEGRVAVFFTEGVPSSAEGELTIDETASTVSLAPNVCVVRGVSAAVEEGEKYVGEFVIPVSGEESAARYLEGEADDNDSFVDIMNGITAVVGAESEGWTFADAPARANLSVETMAEGVVDTSRLPTRESSFFIPHSLLVCWNRMVATHIFHELVFSARLFMKKASWGCCVLVFDSCGEPAGHPEFSDSCTPDCSGTEFEVGRITSCEDIFGATVHAPMGYESSMNCSTFCIRRDLGRFHLRSFAGPIEVPGVEFGEGDISTEAEARIQRRSKSARISRRFVPLARSASASVDFTGRDHSRTLLEQAFDDGMNPLK